MNRAPQLVAQEAVDLDAAALVGGVNGGEHVVLHAGAAEVTESAHHLVEAASTALVTR